jgi:hypothetical protein
MLRKRSPCLCSIGNPLPQSARRADDTSSTAASDLPDGGRVYVRTGLPQNQSYGPLISGSDPLIRHKLAVLDQEASEIRSPAGLPNLHSRLHTTSTTRSGAILGVSRSSGVPTLRYIPAPRPTSSLPAPPCSLYRAGGSTCRACIAAGPTCRKHSGVTPKVQVARSRVESASRRCIRRCDSLWCARRRRTPRS